MNIGLFGGTFDPIHRGHLKVARAAAERFKLKEVWFVPADIPPHKQKRRSPRTFIATRWCRWRWRGSRTFCRRCWKRPMPEAHMERRPSYSIDTVRRVKAGLRKQRPPVLSDRHRCVSRHRQVARGRGLAEGVRVHRRGAPGIFAGGCGVVVAEGVASGGGGVAQVSQVEARRSAVVAGRDACTCLPETHEDVSATQIRAAIKRGTGLKKLVPDAVAEYIRKEGLYGGRRPTAKRKR